MKTSFQKGMKQTRCRCYLPQNKMLIYNDLIRYFIYSLIIAGTYLSFFGCNIHNKMYKLKQRLEGVPRKKVLLQLENVNRDEDILMIIRISKSFCKLDY